MFLRGPGRVPRQGRLVTFESTIEVKLLRNNIQIVMIEDIRYGGILGWNWGTTPFCRRHLGPCERSISLINSATFKNIL